ncbi:lipopolysaccharide biosynthesis protein [Roseivirga sp.]|uniref:lipopolysaccharide biosynthesis protein n=1 Tax=Roseivirga sp. TaxID=1964215 RepID=UPI003B8B7103
MSLKKKGIEGVKWAFLESILAQGFAFVTTIILTRLLIPEDFGLVGIIMVFLAVSRAMVEGGLGVSLIQDQKADHVDYSTILIANFGVSLILYPILYFIAPLVADFYEDERITLVLRVLSLGIIISSISIIQVKVLMKELAFKKLTTLRFPGVVIGSLVGIYCAYSGMSYWSLVVKELVTRVVSATLLWIKSEWKPQLIFNLQKFKYHFNYGYKLMLTSIINSLFNEIHALFIGKMFSLGVLGYYDRATKFVKLPRTLLVTTITKPTFPLLSKIKEDRQKVNLLYRQMIRAMFFFVAPIFIMLAIMAKPLFQILLTDKWFVSVEYFQILCFSSMFYPIQNLNLNIFKIYERTDITLKLALVRKSLTIITLLVGFLAGIKALLWATVAMNIVSFFINSWHSKSMINYATFAQIKDLLFTIVCITIAGLSGHYAVNSLDSSYPIISILIVVVVTSPIYYLFSKWLKNPGLGDFIILTKPFIQNLRKKL